MAQNATIFKVTLEVADIDRAYYHDHALTVARHPSIYLAHNGRPSLCELRRP